MHLPTPGVVWHLVLYDRLQATPKMLSCNIHIKWDDICHFGRATTIDVSSHVTHFLRTTRQTRCCLPLWLFGIFTPILVCCTKKNLATLVPNFTFIQFADRSYSILWCWVIVKNRLPEIAYTMYLKAKSGANPTTLSYNASAVNIYSSNKSMARFRIILNFLGCKNAQAYYNAGVVYSCKFKSRRISSRSWWRVLKSYVRGSKLTKGYSSLVLWHSYILVFYSGCI
jgi:hypothetical protein